MKLNRLFTLLFSVMITGGLYAQAIKEEAKELKKGVSDKDTALGWKYNGFFALNFSQTSLNNWAAGGTGSYAVLGTVNLGARYKGRKMMWENVLLLNYGMVKADGDALQKNDDRIEFLSRLSYNAFAENWYYSAFTSFRTQFNATFDEGRMVSNFMSPAWMQFALGLTYSKNKHFSAMFAPVAGKFTFVQEQRLADSGDYGMTPAIFDPVSGAMLTPGTNFRPEFGAYFIMSADYDIVKNVNFNTRLDLFNNYTDENKPNRKNIDVNWETRINMKVNKLLTTTLFTHLIYDQDVLIELADQPGIKGPRTQFKQVLGVGISYKFE